MVFLCLSHKGFRRAEAAGLFKVFDDGFDILLPDGDTIIFDLEAVLAQDRIGAEEPPNLLVGVELENDQVAFLLQGGNPV